MKITASYIVNTNTSISRAIKLLQDNEIKILSVTDKKRVLLGTITDGDIRRGLEKVGHSLLNEKASFIMSKGPKWVTSDILALSALELMEKHSITSLFVYSNSDLKKPDGIVHIE